MTPDPITDDDNPTNAACLLYETMHDYNWSISDLAKAADLSHSETADTVLHGIGSVNGRPEPRVLYKICKVLELDYLKVMRLFGHIRGKARQSQAVGPPRLRAGPEVPGAVPRPPGLPAPYRPT